MCEATQTLGQAISLQQRLPRSVSHRMQFTLPETHNKGIFLSFWMETVNRCSL